MNGNKALSALLFLITSVASAQQGTEDNTSNLLKTVEVLPPAPNAASLGKYGGINFSLSSGAMMTSIPLYEFSSRELKIPLSLSYHSNGFKVDELSSRVGVGWVLNAGGVITRTVVGGADELSVRASPPPFSPVSRSLFDDFLEPVSWSNNAGGTDAQPDRFSFNFLGYTGEFILDSALNPVPLSKTNLKIEFGQSTSSSVWDFRITNTEGVVFYFGGDSAREETDRDPSGPTCGWDPPEFFPTAFYLKKIVHPNNDSIVFTYDQVGYNYKSNISQSVFYQLSAEYACYDPPYRVCPTLPNTIGTCITWLTTSGVVLKEINSATGGKLVFNYKSRRDVPLDSLVTKIEVFQPGTNAILRVFDLDYQDVFSGLGSSGINSDSSFGYRHFLTALRERSPDSNIVKTHRLFYNKLTELPKRMSYGQDDYGFYNGKYNNTSLIPQPSSLTLQSYFPTANADRDPNSEYAQKGLLSKIVYPTGGTDTIYYEANTTYAQVPVGPSTTAFSTTGDSEALQNPSTNYSDTAVISFTQEAFLYGSCSFYGSSGEEDPIHNKGRIYVYENGNIIYQAILTPGQSITPSPVLNLTSGNSYWIKVVASGVKVTASASFDAAIGNRVYDTINKTAGGVRVAKVITTDSIANNNQIKRYIYSSLNSPDESSGFILNTPVYNKTHIIRTPCRIDNYVIDCQTNNCVNYAMFSSSQTNLYGFSSGFITYRNVVESFGENFENGGIEHEYTVVPDMAGVDLMGNYIVGAPSSNQSITNGREIYSHVFKKINGVTVPLTKTFNHYRDDSRYDSVYAAYVINRKVGGAAACESNPPDDNEINKYDVLKYEIFTNWGYIDTVTTWNYDGDGLSYLEQKNIYHYNNVSHALPTKVITSGSKAELKTVENYYPEDITLSGDAETARQALVNRHIISPPLRTVVSIDASTVSVSETKFGLFSNGLVLPASVHFSTGSNQLETRVQFHRYNSYGRLMQQSKVNDVNLCYLWGYNSAYPVAQAIYADSSDVAYCSFESGETGNWNFTGTSVTDNLSPTGKTKYNLSSGAIAKTGLSSSKYYVISYWTTSPSPYSITGTTSTIQGKTVGAFTYFEHQVTGVTSVNISGSYYIDELRLYPKGALMSTRTYHNLIGPSSECDENNRITYYEYDTLGRLKTIKDQDRNVIKTFDYRYQSTPQQ